MVSQAFVSHGYLRPFTYMIQNGRSSLVSISHHLPQRSARFQPLDLLKLLPFHESSNEPLCLMVHDILMFA